MPYDEEGRFVYSLPNRKKAAPKARKAAPEPKIEKNVPAQPISSKETPEIVTPAITENKNADSVNVAIPSSILASSKIPPTKEVKTLQKNQLEVIRVEKAMPKNEPLVAVRPEKTVPRNEPQIIRTEKFENKTKIESFRDFSELELAYLWNAQNWPEYSPLITTSGEEVQIVYRGRWSGNFGPDFRGAIINIGGELRRGDVELHLKTSGWRQHGHHEDSRYNEVILQVVLQDDEPEAHPTTKSGSSAPVVALVDIFSSATQLREAIEQARENGTRLGSVSESDGPCCERVAERHPDLPALLQQIDTMGEARFMDKALQFESSCSSESGGATQALWAGLLEALGYSQNKTPFRRLAAALTLTTLTQTVMSKRETESERLLTVEAALLGAAGLLPSQRGIAKPKATQTQMPFNFDPEQSELMEDWQAAHYTDELENRWRYLERHIRANASFEADFKPLQERDWTFARLRPPNHPSRRIAGLSRLLLHQKLRNAEDLVENLVQLVLQAGSATEICEQLDEFFVVGLGKNGESDEFWARRFDFAERALLISDTKAKAAIDFVGPDRAADIVVNVVLPFLVGYSRYSNNYQLEETALAAYHVHPRLGSNELVDNVAKQVFRYWLENPIALEIVVDGKAVKKLSVSKLLPTACRQQGLIQLHRRYCTLQDYGDCPLK